MQRIIELLGLLGIRLSQEMEDLLGNRAERFYRQLILWLLAGIMIVPIAVLFGAIGWKWANLVLFLAIIPGLAIVWFSPRNLLFTFLFGGVMYSLSETSRQRFLQGGEAYVRSFTRLLFFVLLIVETVLFYLGFVTITENPLAVMSILIVAIFIALGKNFGGSFGKGNRIVFIAVPSVFAIVAALTLVPPGTWARLGIPEQYLADRSGLDDTTARIGKAMEENRIRQKQAAAESLLEKVRSGKSLAPDEMKQYENLRRDCEANGVQGAVKSILNPSTGDDITVHYVVPKGTSLGELPAVNLPDNMPHGKYEVLIKGTPRVTMHRPGEDGKTVDESGSLYGEADCTDVPRQFIKSWSIIIGNARPGQEGVTKGEAFTYDQKFPAVELNIPKRFKTHFDKFEWTGEIPPLDIVFRRIK